MAAVGGLVKRRPDRLLSHVDRHPQCEEAPPPPAGEVSRALSICRGPSLYDEEAEHGQAEERSFQTASGRRDCSDRMNPPGPLPSARPPLHVFSIFREDALSWPQSLSPSTASARRSPSPPTRRSCGCCATPSASPAPSSAAASPSAAPAPSTWTASRRAPACCPCPRSPASA